MKVCEKCGVEIFTKDGDNRCQPCEDGKRKKTRARRSLMDAVAREMGLKKVRGALGGTYYE